jgi:DNA primase
MGKIDMSEFDMQAYFDDQGIEYTDRGKNSTRNHINIQCPFCNDHSNHCGINIDTNLFHCWICNEKGDGVKLLRQLSNLTMAQVSDLTMVYGKGRGFIANEDMCIKTATLWPQIGTSIKLPDHTDTIMDEMHENYLLIRRYDPKSLIRKYQLQFTHNIGRMRCRIIVPIINKKRMVAWVAADVLRQGGLKYINSKPEESIIPANHCLYNIDSVHDTAIITEGITDVWRVGDGCIASFGKNMTAEQIQMLIEKKPRKVFVMYDADAIEQSHQMADRLKGFFDDVSVLELDDGDPGDMTENDVAELRRMIFMGI